MKKLIAMILAMMLLCACAFAENVYVTISNGQGELVLAREAVDVSDVDADGIISVYDALHAAHDAFYEGGAEAGFGTMNTDYGLSLSKLWGEENGGSYGYYINNFSAYSMTDPLMDGDELRAYAYTDLEAWSDTYCFFDLSAVEAASKVELILSAQSYDADWNVVLLPVEGAVITVNGEDSGVITDAQGKAVIEFAEAGEYLISAHSDAINLVPPVCIATIG